MQPKQMIIVNSCAIGRDPRAWEGPLEFKPERFMGKNIDMIRDLEMSMIPS